MNNSFHCRTDDALHDRDSTLIDLYAFENIPLLARSRKQLWLFVYDFFNF